MTLYNQDAFEVLKTLPDKQVDLIFTDPPYNITAVGCDQEPIDLELMWSEFSRILKPDGVAVVFAAEPFDLDLRIASKGKCPYRYSWIWEKSNATGHLQAKKRPMRAHEMLCVFYKKQPFYSPQMREGKPYKWESERSDSEHFDNYKDDPIYNTGTRYPRSVLRFKQERGLHPLQKPLDLASYIINTYTKSGDLVVDSFMGCGTIPKAAKLLDRQFIGIEKDKIYFDTATERLAN